MPTGEQMFKWHGYSGPCPKPPLPKSPMKRPDGSNADEWAAFLKEYEGATAFLAVQIAEAIIEAAGETTR